MIPLRVLTGCDHNSGFYGIDKKAVIDQVQQFPESHNFLKQKCGSVLPITNESIADLQTFVIRYIYNDTKRTELPDVRAAKWKELKNRI